MFLWLDEAESINRPLRLLLFVGVNVHKRGEEVKAVTCLIYSRSGPSRVNPQSGVTRPSPSPSSPGDVRVPHPWAVGGTDAKRIRPKGDLTKRGVLVTGRPCAGLHHPDGGARLAHYGSRSLGITSPAPSSMSKPPPAPPSSPRTAAGSRTVRMKPRRRRFTCKRFRARARKSRCRAMAAPILCGSGTGRSSISETGTR